MIVIVRFLGTTPSSSNMRAALHSICQQLAYNLEMPMERVPEEFISLKNFFHLLLTQVDYKGLRVVILLGKQNTQL